MGDDHVYFKDPNGEYVSCTFCARVQMRRPHDSYLWFNYETNRGHQNSLLIAISENTTKEGIKWPATKKISFVSLGVIKNKRPKSTTSGDK